MDIKKAHTDNPFMDSLVYCVKILAFGSIIKLAEKADNAETVSSLKQSDLYIASVEGKGVFDLFTYTEDLLNKSSVPKAYLSTYLKDKYLIPVEYRDELTRLAVEDCITNYNEENEYYRMICGLPPLNDYGIPMKNYKYLIPEGNVVNVSYVHQLGSDGAKMLELYGILDIIKADYPDAKYLDYITAGISIYKARKAMDFQILYMPSTSILEIDNKFATKYEDNRAYIIRTTYSQAFKISSDYYDNFIAMLIVLSTMTDMIAEVQEHIVKKDILDARCIEYIFSVYGIPYYHNIPLKYQAAMCRNVNSLIKYKSCKMGMINLISLFGMNDIEMFKYFILRDRRVDKWGDFIYNEITEISSKENDVVIPEEQHKPISDNTIPYPFDYFLQKGNEMFVWLDDYKLKEGIDYTVYNYNKIEFKNGIDSGKSNIRYDFYYDKTTINSEVDVDKENGITMVTEVVVDETGSRSVIFNPPYPEYFIDKNCMIVMLGSVFIDQKAYELDLSTNTITINGNYETKGRQITFIYLYGKKLITSFQINNVKATTEGQFRFKIPEPFSDYVDNENDFFVTIGSTYIDSRRYTTQDGDIIFNDLAVSKGREVSFHFIYSSGAIYAPIDVKYTSETIIATDYYQYNFTINYPIENYLKFGYKVYIKVRGWFLSDDYYDVYRNNITFRDKSIALQPGDKLEVYYAYGPTAKNIVALKDYRVAETAYQDTFDISYPVDNYFIKGNKVIVDTGGSILLEGSGYVFNSDKTKITIKDKKYLPYSGIRVNYTFVYNNISEYAIKLQPQVIKATEDNQKTFYLNFPFYPYLETTQGFIILHNSAIVHNSLISINKYDCVIDLQGIKKGDEIVILYIFNNKYLLNKERVLIVEEKTVTTNKTIDDDLTVQVPVPFYDYIDHGWGYFVDSARGRIDPSLFEVVGNDLVFFNAKDILKYGSLTFTFVYKESYIVRTSVEDYAKDISLKFVKIPLNAKTNTEYLTKLTNTKSYDSVTLSDKFWDGEDNQDNAHAAIEAAILKQEFNYARTKYMTVEYVLQLTDMSFEISYFYNMLYDDVFKEELLTANIPTISPNKQFKLSHLFCYMTALSYMYSGITDSIMDTPTKVLYVKGFNFKSDLKELRQYVLDERRLPKDFDVFNFINPEDQIPSIEEFVHIYKTNKEVYKTICYNMVEARNYDIYKIWKKMYDSLMIYEFNLEFFKMNDDTVSPTFTAFLQEKDNVLYTSLKTIEKIADKESRENTIVTMISDIVYILEEYIDKDEFKFIYNQYPGVSKEYILQYLFTMINFFKSYKILIPQMTVQWVLDDKNKNSIKLYDTQAMQVHLHKPDYITITEEKQTKISLHKEERIEILEKINLSYYWIP